MIVNMGAIRVLLQEKFNGNKAEMARNFGISKYHIGQIFKSNGKCAGKKFIVGVIKYCEENNYDFKDYIFLN